MSRQLRCTTRLTVLFLLAAFALRPHPAAAAAATGASLQGDWLTPDHSAVHIFSCGADLCIRIARIAPDIPYGTDGLNPDSTLRTRPLCGLVIGRGFHPTDAGHASDGELYDPKSGKTYHGMMAADANQLKLRGYIGVPLFGRTETWTRSPQPVAECANPK